MRLQRLTHLERNKLEEEARQLEATIARLEELLNNRLKMNELLETELLEIKARYGDPRRTRILTANLPQEGEEEPLEEGEE